MKQSKITRINEKGESTFIENGKFVDLDKKFNDYKERAFKEYVDLDLFGYMFPNGTRRFLFYQFYHIKGNMIILQENKKVMAKKVET